MRRRSMMTQNDGGDDDEMREMTLIGTIDIANDQTFAANNGYKEFDVTDVTEIWIEYNGVKNDSTTDSSVRVLINGTDPVDAPIRSAKSSTANPGKGWVNYRWNGRVWIVERAGNNTTSDSKRFDTAQVPYTTPAIGKASKIMLMNAASPYFATSGTISVYAR